jgi:hypothetical protein
MPRDPPEIPPPKRYHPLVLRVCPGAQALSSVPLAFLRIVSLVIFFILSRLAATERAKGRLWQNQFMSYGTAVRASFSITVTCMEASLGY